ncbi:terminase [Rhodococcus marinonascens]|uniref:terminase n=1 Tax=Rhodococcus marinonascens TaxID=38311 RepID=UPI0009323523|nr:terminase [Rhodococcus marinonascens]
MPALWLPNPDPGITICAGFDGSENNDWTAIRCETLDGLQFTPRYGPDRRPTIWNPAEWGGQVPRGEVHAAVDEIFTTWRVGRFYADPQDWYSEIGDWSLKYGEDHVSEWPTNKIDRMFHAIRRFETDLSTGRITQDGCPITETAMANCKKVAKPGQKYILGKPADHQKIDPAMASILAHEATADARESGCTDEVADNRMFCF